MKRVLDGGELRSAPFDIHEPIFNNSVEDLPQDVKDAMTQFDIDCPALGRAVSTCSDIDWSAWVAMHMGDNFISKNGKWYAFDGTIWQSEHYGDPEKLLLTTVKRLFRDVVDALASKVDIVDGEADPAEAQLQVKNRRKTFYKNRNHLLSGTTEKKIVGQLAKSFLAKEDAKFDDNPDLLGFKGYVYSFQRGTFRPSRRDDYITKSVGFTADEVMDASSSLMNNLLKDMFPDDDVRTEILDVFARCITARRDQKITWLLGGGANGKSSLMNIFSLALGGPKNYSSSLNSDVLVEMKQNSNAATNALNVTEGRRLAIVEEVDKKALNEGIIKMLTSPTMQFRELYQSFHIAENNVTFIVCSNEFPTISGIDDGIWRRLRIFQCETKFVDDPIAPHHRKRDDSIVLGKSKEHAKSLLKLLFEHIRGTPFTDPREPPEIMKYWFRQIRDSMNPVPSWVAKHLTPCLKPNTKNCRCSTIQRCRIGLKQMHDTFNTPRIAQTPFKDAVLNQCGELNWADVQFTKVNIGVTRTVWGFKNLRFKTEEEMIIAENESGDEEGNDEE